ncbi:disease resistance protein RPS6-like [Hevea brasiliensis]|uniref:disease resistance protein RPS6-like n=1 Tax=Hevea brasiliensis TaxID=3981 RepID=UPI0025D7BE1E|nr:disease resistance protein RPS6-like [Hevea brasiliensis]
MHDLIQEMGQNIARRKGRRLWNSKDIFHMLSTKMGMKKVEGIFLDMSELGKIHLGHVAFPQMHNLRLLKCYRPQNWSENKIIGSTSESSEPSHLLHLSNKLSLLHWDEYPYKSLPSNFLMENLVEINMQGSKVEQLWNGRKCPQQLKRLNLSESVHLRRLPNLSSATELEWISLQGCESLLEIPMSIQCLQKLVCLDLQGCKKLRSLPNLVRLKSLKELSPSYCSNLKMLPEIPIGIEELELEDCGLKGCPHLFHFWKIFIF